MLLSTVFAKGAEVNELPFDPIVFGLLAFGILSVLIVGILMFGKGRPHS